MQSLNQTTFANHDHTISPTTDTDSDRPSIPEKRKNRNGRNRNSAKEPDSGISSTIGSATRPWSQTDATMDLDQVNSNIYVKICSLNLAFHFFLTPTHVNREKKMLLLTLIITYHVVTKAHF